MNIEEQIRAAFRTEMGDGHDETTVEQYEEFERYYRGHALDAQRQTALEDAADAAQYGFAAYVIGSHLMACHRHDEAEAWLRVAAERDVGDATFRLASLYEDQAVDDYNTHLSEEDEAPETVDEKFSEAYYWYRRAAHSGYAIEDYPSPHKLEQPLLSLDCCSAVRAVAAEEQAVRTLADAEECRQELLRDARDGVQHVVQSAREELNELALRHERLSVEVGALQEIHRNLTQLASRPVFALPRLALLIARSCVSPQARKTLAGICSVYRLNMSGLQAIPYLRPRRRTHGRYSLESAISWFSRGYPADNRATRRRETRVAVCSSAGEPDEPPNGDPGGVAVRRDETAPTESRELVNS